MSIRQSTVTQYYCLCVMAGLVLVLAGCSAGTGVPQASGSGAAELSILVDLTQLSAKLSLKVLPESFAYGSGGGQFKLSTTRQEDLIVVHVTGSGMTDLRALFAELSYPADELTPVAASAQLSGKAGQTLDLARMERRGIVELGTVLEHCDKQTGISGNAELAYVRFIRRAFSAGKNTSAANVLPPCLDDSRPALGVNCTTGQIEWEHRLPGDYNQNGHVGLEDLTPLAIHWGDESFSTNEGNAYLYNSIQDVIDTNDDAQINLAELTALGAHMGSDYEVQIESFNLYRSLDPAADMPKKTGPHGWDSASTIASFSSVSFNTAIGDRAQERLHFSAALPGTESGMAYWVRPEAGGTEGAPSNYATYDPTLAGDFVLRVEPQTFFVAGAADISLEVSRRQNDALLEVWARNAVGLQLYSVNISFDPAKYKPAYSLQQNIQMSFTQDGHYITGTHGDYDAIILGKIFGYNNGDGNTTDAGFTGDACLFRVTAELAPQTGTFSDRVHDDSGPYDSFAGSPCGPGHVYQIAYNPVSQELTWDYYSIGDYDQDGIVLSDDLALLAFHWGEIGPFDPGSLQFFIDVKLSDQYIYPRIYMEDLAYVGAEWLNCIDSYNVYSATDIADVPVVDQPFKGNPGVAPIGSVPFSSAVGDPMTERLHFKYHVENPQSGQYLWVQTAYKGAIGAAGYNCYAQVP